MRKILFVLLLIGLTVIVAARAMLPEPAQSVMADSVGWGYNILDLDLPITTETAGSSLIAEMNSYYLFRIPTAKSAYTGRLSGKNLIVICAENWLGESAADPEENPAVYQLWQEGVQFTDVYRPDWYQQMDGREFALLSGLMPTNVNGESAMLWAGRQNVYLPYALAKCLGREGYTCLAFSKETENREAYKTLGFTDIWECEENALETLKQTMSRCEGEAPYFAYYVWDDADGEAALSYLLETLETDGTAEDTVVCLFMGNSDLMRGHWFLWGAGLSGASVDDPCSDLDVTPTLLNLFGVTYDSRFLSGRDVFAGNYELGEANAVTPLVSLYGSALSDWVTVEGSYCAGESVFWQTQDCFSDSASVTAYVQKVNQLVYDRYVFARRVMENNYFHVALSSLEN